MTSKTIAIFLPVFFAALVLCAVGLCACYRVMLFGRYGSPAAPIDVEKAPPRRRKHRRRTRGTGSRYGDVSTHESEHDRPAVQHVEVDEDGNPIPVEHLDIYDAEPDTSGIDGESIDVVDAVPGGRRGGRGGGGGGGGRRAGSGGDASPAGGRFLGMF